MAKSARASITKKNHRNLRAKVFGPAHDARTARLSAKLQELVGKPTPDEEKRMEVEENVPADDNVSESPSDEDMEGVGGVKAKPSKKTLERKQAARREHKISKKKAKHQMTFASERARKRKAVAGKKSKR